MAYVTVSAEINGGMTMSPTERAKTDLARMQTELGKMQAQIAILQNRIVKVGAYIEMAALYEVDDSQAELARTRGNGIAATAVRIAIELIKEKGESLPTRQILKGLSERGVQIGGSNPVANLSGFLSRSNELRNSRAYGWGLIDWTYPPDEQLNSHDADDFSEEVRQEEELQAKSVLCVPLVPAPPLPLAQRATPTWEPATADDLDDDIPF